MSQIQSWLVPTLIALTHSQFSEIVEDTETRKLLLIAKILYKGSIYIGFRQK